ncbi:hypothetical protein CY34DRAFT_801943 [Suillus luteus UH-Slu-Lm8-n1]|uniref:Uncharacterized protein n=1 Tax=Suillus luteus UH-Slu-Lm8-n1 TaxID=930992 RepID=A0A0D0A4R6_9AGAM|nr:hypothetical protein CY34DRAFT_801943 [Suillus luteus UH-Slu-Lm8-n1]
MNGIRRGNQEAMNKCLQTPVGIGTVDDLVNFELLGDGPVCSQKKGYIRQCEQVLYPCAY